MGILDLVVRAGDGATVIVDFKTGAPRELHREQLLLYAVLWWRCTLHRPDRIAVQYLDDGWEEPVSEADLKRAEKRIASEIAAALKALDDRPAAPRVSKECVRCPVRARCDEGWAQAEPAKLPPGRNVDVEVVVGSPPCPTGFTGRRRDGSELPIVYELAVGAALPSLAVETRLRLVDGIASAQGDAVQLRHWSEVFLL